MTPKRKHHEVYVSPGWTGWKLTYDGLSLGVVPKKADAVTIGHLVAQLSGLDGTTSLRIHGRRGRILEERTFKRADDPKRTKG